LEKNRKIKGNLDFDFPETKIVLTSPSIPLLQGEGSNKKELIVTKIMQYPRYESNKMIELFMVSANHSISKMFSSLPFLHRIHPEPSEDDIEKLQ
jgi:ribonuclease R